MRRSRAPSMKVFGKPDSVGPRNTVLLQVPIDKADQTVVDLLQSEENHTRVLENFATDRKLKAASLSKGPVESTIASNIADPKIRFNVVWGKKSTKKHKTWEGDGTLELCGRSATLRDEEGKVIGSSTGIKMDTIEEGSRLIVGSKEVEVIEKCLSSDRIDKGNSQLTTPAKKQKLNTFKAPKSRDVLVELPLLGKSFKQVCATEETPSDFVPLVMQPPSFEHQWKYNFKKAPVSNVTVPYSLARHLRPHQREGISFLYKCILGFHSTESNIFGAILADEMGLGKTLQCISLIYTLLKQGPYGQPILKRVLIVTPSSLVENWDKEINKWLTTERIFTFIVSPNNKLKKYVQSSHIPILIMSYELLSKQIEELNSVKFDLIVCDEGHRLKNSGIKVSSILDGIDCPRRILLTGTPIQNDLQEFFSLIDFVNPGLLGTYPEFKSKYENPIMQAQQPNVNPQFRHLGMTRLEELNTITSSFILRRTQEVINKYLPDKQEVVVFVQPSKLQVDLFSAALLFYDQSGPSAISPLQLITILKKICNHPSLISTNEKSNVESLTKILNDKLPPWQNMGPTDSGKLVVLDSLLENLIERQEKVVVVSYYSKTLDMIMGLCEHYNYKFCRLDGSTPTHDRCKIVSNFNNPSSDVFIFLLSAKAGGIGLNLIGASRLVLYDNDWNPASDLQAMSRIWRDGQTRTVFIYRLITAFSIEEKIYQRQISKTSLSGTVVDQKQNLSNLKFSNEELKDLFSQIEQGSDCLTHQMLDCECRGVGDIPEPTSNSSQDDNAQASPERSRFQIRFVKTKHIKPKHSLKMQELMRWEHYRTPIDKDVLQELSLTPSEDIIFIFRNRVKQHDDQRLSTS